MSTLHWLRRSGPAIFGPSVFAALLLTMSTGACDLGTAGTSIGTFAAVGTLTSNTCGTSLGAEATWDFDVALSVDGSTIYWQQDGAASIDGTLDANDSATIVSTSTESYLDAGSACVMTSTNTVVVTLGPGEEPTTASGTITVNFATDAVSACAEQLSANGGAYQTLPCSVSYTYTATKSSK